MKVVILDLGLSNLRSVRRALEALGHEVLATCDPEAIATARVLVLPGVGSFGEASRRLDATGTGTAIRAAVASGGGILGICLGMQLLFEASQEEGAAEGLGLLPGQVVRLGDEVSVPHIGWNTVHPTSLGARLFSSGDDEDFYFVHSYVVSPSDTRLVAAHCLHGDKFAAAIEAPRLIGLQFHPEKSGLAGSRLLARALGTIANVSAV